jgi:hypothetical protein
MVVNVQINTILAYSARKKKTNITAACSVINPLTSSDSASAKSKGALLVSATDPIKKIINTGNKGIINQMALWLSMLLVRFKLPLNKITRSIAELSISS